MLSEENYKVLKLIRDTAIVQGEHFETIDRDRLNYLMKCGYVTTIIIYREVPAFGSGTAKVPKNQYALTPFGEDAISAFEAAANDHAKAEIQKELDDEKQRVRDRKDTARFWIEVIGVIVSFVSGVLLQDNFDLLGRFVNALKLLGGP